MKSHNIKIVLVSVIAVAFSIFSTGTATALVQGQLHSTAQLQQYAGSIYPELPESTYMFSPVQDSRGNLRSLAIDEKRTTDGGYEEQTVHLVTLSPHGKVLRKTLLENFSLAPPMLAIDRNDNIYFGGSGINPERPNSTHVYRYDTEHNNTLDIVPAENDHFFGITVATDDTIYVSGSNSEANTNYIATFDQSGSHINTLNLAKYKGFDAVTGALALDSQNKLYSMINTEQDPYQTHLVEIGQTGAVIREIDTYHDPYALYTLSVDQDDNLYTSSFVDMSDTRCGDFLNLTIYKYSSAGTRLGSLDTSPEASDGRVCPLYGAEPSRAAATTGIATNGDLFVSSITVSEDGHRIVGNRIVKYSYPHTRATFAQNSHTAKTKLAITDSAQLVSATTNSQTDLAAPPDTDWHYPLGLVKFTAKTKSTAPVDVTLLFETTLEPHQVVARKYNTVTKQYGDIPGATVTKSQLDGKPALQVAYQVSDGGALDEDGLVNGEIIDPVGLGVRPAETPVALLAPNTGHARLASLQPTLFASIAAAIATLAITRKIATRRSVRRKL